MNTQDISVLIQGGGIDEKTVKSVKSIKRFLPDSEIVLSTWEGENTEDLNDYNVKVLKFKDPGKIVNATLGNTNRQILGRREGLKFCSRPYTLIMRQDSVIINTNFITRFEADYKRDMSRYAIFKNRIVACSAHTFHLFFLCDWFFFGETQDLIEFYNINLFDDEQKGEYLTPEYHTPHEYLGINFAKKYDANLNYSFSDREQDYYQNLWKNLLVDNFVMIGFYNNYGIVNLKEPYYHNQLRNSRLGLSAVHHLALNLEYEDWLKIYSDKYGKNGYKSKFRLEYVLSIPVKYIAKIRLTRIYK